MGSWAQSHRGPPKDYVGSTSELSHGGTKKLGCLCTNSSASFGVVFSWDVEPQHFWPALFDAQESLRDRMSLGRGTCPLSVDDLQAKPREYDRMSTASAKATNCSNIVCVGQNYNSCQYLPITSSQLHVY